MLFSKNENSLEKKIVSLRDILQASRNPVRTRKFARQS